MPSRREDDRRIHAYLQHRSSAGGLVAQHEMFDNESQVVEVHGESGGHNRCLLGVSVHT